MKNLFHFSLYFVISILIATLTMGIEGASSGYQMGDLMGAFLLLIFTLVYPSMILHKIKTSRASFFANYIVVAMKPFMLAGIMLF